MLDTVIDVIVSTKRRLALQALVRGTASNTPVCSSLGTSKCYQSEHLKCQRQLDIMHEIIQYDK